MQRLLVAGLVLTVLAAVTADRATAGATVDLTASGALEALEKTNPVHFEKVQRILAGITHRTDVDVARWMQVAFNARDVGYAPISLTSHPAQRRLSFSLDDTRYVGVVVLTNLRGEISPAK